MGLFLARWGEANWGKTGGSAAANKLLGKFLARPTMAKVMDWPNFQSLHGRL